MFEIENLQPSQFKGRNIILSMCRDIDWDQRERNEKVCEQNSLRVAAYASLFQPGRWTFLGPDHEGNGIETNQQSSKIDGTLQRRS